MFSAPQPRSRLYTTTAAYGKGVRAALAGYDRTRGCVEQFERALSEMHGGARAVAMPMARVGIYLALKHLVRKGQKVILSPYTIADVVNMVLCAGAVPLFADTEADGSCNIDAAEVERLLAGERNVGAVLVTHFYGLMCDVSRIRKACEARGVPLVEDAAQAFGARNAEGAAGNLGHAGIFSFGLLKNVTSFIGGALLTRDTELEEKIRKELAGFPVFPARRLLDKMARGAAFERRDFSPVFDTGVYWLFRSAYLHGFEFFKNQLDTDANPRSYSAFPEAYACRMSEAQADMICAQLSRCRRDTEERIAKAQLYHDGLKDLPRLVLPPMRKDGSHIYLYYPLQCEDRDGLARFMTRHLRDVQISHHRNCAGLECFSAYARDCPNAERAARSLLYLPTYPGYREDQVKANIAAIRAYFREANSWA